MCFFKCILTLWLNTLINSFVDCLSILHANIYLLLYKTEHTIYLERQYIYITTFLKKKCYLKYQYIIDFRDVKKSALQKSV